jgi:hypothetical protein
MTRKPVRAKLSRARRIVRNYLKAGAPLDPVRLQAQHNISHATFEAAIAAERVRKPIIAGAQHGVGRRAAAVRFQFSGHGNHTEGMLPVGKRERAEAGRAAARACRRALAARRSPFAMIGFALAAGDPTR